MKGKHKLALIQNYVTLHRLIFKCESMKLASLQPETKAQLDQLLELATELKNKYLKTFDICKMNDCSLALLKSQLTNALAHSPNKDDIEVCDIAVLQNDLVWLDRERNRLMIKII